MNEVINFPVAIDKENSGPRKYSPEWFDTPEGILDGRLDMLHLLRAILRRDPAELSAERMRLGEGENFLNTAGLIAAVESLRDDLLVWADREFAAAEQELAKLRNA